MVNKKINELKCKTTPRKREQQQNVILKVIRNTKSSVQHSILVL